jgi:hypothetical protein
MSFESDPVSRLIDKTGVMLQRLHNLKSRQKAPPSTSDARHYSRATATTGTSPHLKAELNRITDTLDVVSRQVNQFKSRLIPNNAGADAGPTVRVTRPGRDAFCVQDLNTELRQLGSFS